MRTYLDFEKPIAELESKVEELRAQDNDPAVVSIEQEITQLREKAHRALEDLYSKLQPWQKTQVARHPDRPHTLDYIGTMIEDFVPHGR